MTSQPGRFRRACLEPVAARHHEIGEHDVDLGLVEQGDRLVPRAGGMQHGVGTREQVPEQIEDVFVVFRDEEGPFHPESL